jgi:hypothetical protein
MRFASGAVEAGAKGKPLLDDWRRNGILHDVDDLPRRLGQDEVV